jgi:hypothetical protein
MHSPDRGIPDAEKHGMRITFVNGSLPDPDENMRMINGKLLGPPEGNGRNSSA